MKFGRGAQVIAATLALCAVPAAHAQVDSKTLAPALARMGDGGMRFLRAAHGGTAPAWIVSTTSTEEAARHGFIPLTENWALSHDSRSALEPVSSEVGRHFLSSLRFPQLDIASKELRVPQAQEDWGLRGDGTIVGIVDTGADPAHPALRHSDGRTKIAWMLVFDMPPRGKHGALEDTYGCNGPDSCAVFSSDDINDLLDSSNQVALPKDPIGHGTHIASLAAGRDADYPGVAPDAELIVVAAATDEGGVTDARILLGTKFVFERAEQRNQPAVVNVSLGSSFGAHDGSSGIERGLADLASGPGRAVVVASGNVGGSLDVQSEEYVGPFGIHTEVKVSKGVTQRVSLLHPRGGSDTTFGSLFVWVSAFEGDALTLGFGNGRGAETRLVAGGDSGTLDSSDIGDPDDYEVILVNGVDELDADLHRGNMVLGLAGSFQAGRTFELLLGGEGTARIWVTGPQGDFSTVLPRSRAQGTVTIPGSDPDLITVGATINRFAWEDFQGNVVGSREGEPGLSFFSSLGPNQLGQLKPELVAPGAGVIGAMARAADPRRGLNSSSQFASSGACPDETECFVIDDEHGIASGTSMAAPLVAGAVALLLQRQPELSMAELKSLLMAGTNDVDGHRVPGGMGTGQLDIVRSLLAQDAELRGGESREVNPQKSYLAWADTFVHPAPAPGLSGYLVLRDQDGMPVAVDELDLQVSVEGPGRAQARIVSAGLARLELTADEGSGTQEIHIAIRVDGVVVERSTVPIELDPLLADGLYEFTGGTCSLPSTGRRDHLDPTIWLFLSCGVLVILRRRTFAPRKGPQTQRRSGAQESTRPMYT